MSKEQAERMAAMLTEKQKAQLLLLAQILREKGAAA